MLSLLGSFLLLPLEALGSDDDNEFSVPMLAFICMLVTLGVTFDISSMGLVTHPWDWVIFALSCVLIWIVACTILLARALADEMPDTIHSE